MATQPVFVALITNQPLVRAGLTALAAGHRDRVVVLSEAEANLHPDRIELFVYDATVQPVANADALGELMGVHVPVVALGGDGRDGSSAPPTVDVLPLSLTREEMMEAVRLAVRGPRRSAEAAHQIHLREIALMAHLTERQVAILECIGSGWSNPEIASDLGIGVHTVKRETKRILTEIDAPDRLHAVLWAAQHGLAARPHVA